jgi:hypothetical protein
VLDIPDNAGSAAVGSGRCGPGRYVMVQTIFFKFHYNITKLKG